MEYRLVLLSVLKKAFAFLFSSKLPKEILRHNGVDEGIIGSLPAAIRLSGFHFLQSGWSHFSGY